MGGYALALSSSARRFFPDLPPRTVLTGQLLNNIANMRIDIFPDISEAQIRDKSKASALAKTLVCFQGIWFCMQFVARLSQNLTVSLLELNTFAHALCAFLVYLLWWNKPLDIEEPTIMQGELIDALYVALYYYPTGSIEIQITEDLDRLVRDIGDPSAEGPFWATFEDGIQNPTIRSLETNQCRTDKRCFDYIL